MTHRSSDKVPTARTADLRMRTVTAGDNYAVVIISKIRVRNSPAIPQFQKVIINWVSATSTHLL